MTLRVLILLVAQGAFALNCVAQEVKETKHAPRDQAIDLTKASPILGLPFTGIFGAPFTCSSDGEIFVSLLVQDKNGGVLSNMPDLYRISAVGDGVKPIPRSFLDGYEVISVPGFFAGSNVLVSLIRASQVAGKNGSRAGSGNPDYFLMVSDRDGDHKRIIRLDLDFDVVKVAAFDTGELIAFGSDSKTSEPVIALLHEDGRFMKRLDAFSRIDEKSSQEKGSADQAVAIRGDKKRLAMDRAAESAKFAPWGNDIVMALPGVGGLAIYRFRASGQFEKTNIVLPGDEEIEGVLGTGGKDNWVIRTRTGVSRKTMSESRLIQNPEDFLYEVNPHNGEVLRRLNVAGPAPGEVACAADGKLSALYVAQPAQPGGSERLFFASASR